MVRLIGIVFFILLCSSDFTAQLRISPEKINFGEFTRDSEAVVDIIVENVGSKTDYLLRSTFSTSFEVRWTDKKIEPGQQIVIRIKFNPRAKGNFKEVAELYFASMDKPIMLPIEADVKYVNVNGSTPCPDFNSKVADCCAQNFFIVEVYDAETKKPIEEAFVKLEEDGYLHLKLKTGEDGKVSQSAQIGFYNLIAEKPGYISQVKTSYVNNANSKFIFYLEKDPNYKPNIIVPEEVIEILEQPIEKDTSAFSVDQFSANNIVFLLDISGSMGVGDKLSLMKYSLNSLVEILRPVDEVAMISYANEAKVLLPTTGGDHKSEMIELVDGIVTGGKTSGGKGFKKAFQLIKKNYIEGGNNQLIVITDGAFAIDDQKVIEKLVAKAAKKGIVTTVVAIESNSFAKEKLLLVSQAGKGSLLLIEDEQSADRILIEEIKKQSAK